MGKHLFEAFKPTYHCARIFDIEPSFFLQKGYTHIFIDLDNTLASYRSLTPNEEVVTWIQALKQSGLHPIVVSNNREQRVRNFCQYLAVPYLAQAGKPFPKRIRKYLMHHQINPKNVILIGDQLLTDCWVANQLKIDSMLTDKLVKEDHWPTQINRILEGPIRRWLKKKNLLKPWRESK